MVLYPCFLADLIKRHNLYKIYFRIALEYKYRGMQSGPENTKGFSKGRYQLVLLSLFVWISFTAYARILYYPGHAATIQETIDLALDGDTIVILAGLYFENIQIREKAITLSSEFILDGDSGHIRRTIIDGSRWTDSLRRSTISLIDCRDTTTIVRGLTITGGSGSQIFVGPAEHWCGGGLIIFESSAKVLDNIIEGNHLDYKYKVNVGAGMLAAAADGDFIVIRNNLIIHNSIETAMEINGGGLWVGVGKNGRLLAEKNRILENRVFCSGPHMAHGGGVGMFGTYPEGAILLFRDNLVAQNRVEADPGGDNFKARGGGIDIIYYDFKPESRICSPSLRIYGNRILDNISSDQGGGIAFMEGNAGPNKESPICPQVYLSGNILEGNRAEFGAGIHNYNVAFIMVGNRLENDLSIQGSGEIWNEDVTYAHLNHGIINASDNQVQGDWPAGRGIFQDYPYVRSFAHRWKLIEDNPELIKIRYVPPASRQWWAIGLYVLVLVAIFWLYRHYLFYRFNLKAALVLEQKEKERIRHLDEVRTRFFANVSHEFRTPLTLISGPVEDLLKHASLEEKHRRDLEMARRNVHRLQQMTGQLLDLSKLESGTVKLKVSKGNLGEFVKSIASSFISLSESRNILYRMEIPQLPEDLYFDADKLEKIICNLLSNALKFTPVGGRVDLSLECVEKNEAGKNHYLNLRVTDSGRGMTEEQEQRIFDRFYSEGRLHQDDPEGIGIGMSLVREMVDLYRGSIRVKSEPGKGSSFELELPASAPLFAMEEISDSLVTPPKAKQRVPHSRPTDILLPGLEEPGDEGPGGAEKEIPLILLVEDNLDLRNYIIGHLEDGMKVLEAENGRIGLELAREQIPDLVISDLMMPEMDGVTLLQELRSDDRTCHIPFFMLTARADIASKIESFEKGTDEYIEKPFHPEVLKARIVGILNRRINLVEHYRREFLQDPGVFLNQHFGENFLNRVIECIRTDLSNQDFGVSILSEKMHMSRVQLYRKISSTTGFSPVEFIRNIRVKAAAELFSKTDLNVTQVMLEVGYGSPSYFAECFRGVFGCNPSEYRGSQTERPAAARGREEGM